LKENFFSIYNIELNSP